MHIFDEAEVEKTFVERAPVLPVPQHAPSPARPLVGRTRIGFGLVVDTIGIGGMASVYKVWNERLEIFRAVKMLSAETLHTRFETEAKITAKLHHPHIVEVYSVGEWNGVPYMEMEYVDGVNMQEALEARGRFPDAVCCAAALCVASALDYAHTLKFNLGGNSYDGIIHRDLKPANVLISKRSEIKLTDFGIARPAQASLHTVDGNIVGTLHYLSPEQLRGGKIDLRSDIYSLGAILYEMATGAKTFPQKDITELTMQRAANNFKPPNEYDTPVTPAVSNIILKCLKTSPQERYRHVAELIRDLQKAYAEIAPKCAPQKMLHDFFSEDTAETGITPTVLINVDTDTDYAVDATSVIDKDSVVDTDFIVNTDPIVDNDPFIVNNDSVIDDDHVIINTDSIIDIDSIVDINPITNDDPIIVDTDSFVDDNHIIVNTDSVVDTDNIIDDDPIIDTVDHSKPTFKLSTRIIPPTKRTIAYATITLLTLLSASYITIKLISHPSPKPANKQTNANATATFTNSLPTPINTDTNVITSENILPTVNTHTSESAANAVNSADLNATVIDTADVNNAAVNTADTNTTDVHAIDVNTANINTKAAAPAPAPTENAIIKSALEAIDRHEWDRAIRILEKGGPAFTEKRGERHLLLFEAYVESRQLEKARSVFDSAAKTNDALYFLTAGRYMFYRGDHAGALATLEASLTRSSAMRGRNAIFGDAMYYIAMIMSDRFRTSPTEANRRQAQEAWRRVRSAYESIPESPRFKRAETEILELY